MIIELAGLGTRNKGAELMAAAIAQRFQLHHPDVQLAVRGDYGSWKERVRLGFRLVLPKAMSLRWWLFHRLVTSELGQPLGVVKEGSIDAVVDASGFAFGDQLPYKRTLEFLGDVRRWRKESKKIVLLPQAFGPFEKPDMKAAMSMILEHSDLVFARDQESFQHLASLDRGVGNISVAPDFTCLVKPISSAEVASLERACIVPNQRMIEYAKDESEVAAYLDMITRCVKLVEESGIEPVFLVHSAGDGPLVDRVQARLAQSIAVITEWDPVQIKAEIGRSRLVIGSRFHALVSALSQNVPAIATSWSHKYEMLFNDYGCADLVLPVEATQHDLAMAIERALGEERPRLLADLQSSNKRILGQTNQMWRRVDETLGLRDGDCESAS